MAKDITGKNIKASSTTKMQAVYNRDPKTSSDKFYFAIRVQIDSSDIEYIKALFLQKYGKENTDIAFNKDNGEVTLLLTEEDVLECLYRASKNPEDIPKASIFMNIAEEITE